MDSWSRGPFSESPSYAGVRVRDGSLEEFDGGQASVTIALDEIKVVRLAFGMAAERLAVQLVLGCGLLLGGGWAAARVLGALLAGRGSVLPFFAALCVLGAGLAVIAVGLRRRFYLDVETASQRRKLVFARGAEPRGLSLLFARLQKRGVTVSVPSDFVARSQFAMVGARPAGLRTLERPVSARGVSSFSLSAEDDVLFERLTTPLADWLVGYLEKGADIRDRETISFGMQLFLAEVSGGHLTLLSAGAEPDQWSVDLTRALRIQFKQGLVAESFGLALDPPNPLLLVSIALDAAKGPVLMNRLVRDEELQKVGHSGWFIWSVAGQRPEQPSESSATMPIQDLAMFRADLLEYMALPPGMSVGFVGDKPQIMRGDEALTPTPGSYIDARCNGLALPPHLTGSA